jgi:hypothetical protein
MPFLVEFSEDIEACAQLTEIVDKDLNKLSSSEGLIHIHKFLFFLHNETGNS